MLNSINAMSRRAVRRKANESPPVVGDDGEYENTDHLLSKGHVGGNLVTSVDERDERKHLPVLDLDVPANLYPSKNLDHWHLLLDVAMPWWKYALLLRVLSFVGIIEKGYSHASRKRGYSAVRRPLAMRHRAAVERIQDAWEADPNVYPWGW